MNENKLIIYFFYFLFFIQFLRLFYINLFYKKILEEKTKNQYLISKISNIMRSNILDINGLFLAKNKESNSLCCSSFKNLSLNFLNYLKKNYFNCYKKIIENKNKHFFYIKRKITQADEEFFKNNFESDIFFLKEYERIYPYSFISPLIGFVDIDMNGISGLEYSLNSIIYGDRKIKKDNFFEITENESFVKNSIKTTIDANLSYKIFNLIKESCIKNESEYITAVVMDSNNGNILTCVQYPYYDPINENKDNLIFEKPFAITEAYEMGSILKAFCMLAALDEKIVNFDDLIDCRNTKNTFIKKLPVNTWKEHGIIPFYQVIRESNNIGIAQVAMKIDKKLYNHYKKLGFGEKLNLEIPGEAKGFITHPKKWSAQSILSLSYGYEISTSLLQLISAWSVFSENGNRIIPRFLISTPIRKIENLYSLEVINIAKSIIEYDEKRIFKKDFQYLKDFKIYGKTGTANILENGKYNPEKNTYVFVGHIEKENYKRIIGVYIRLSNKKNIYASSIAQPLFFEITKKLIIHDKININNNN